MITDDYYKACNFLPNLTPPSKTTVLQQIQLGDKWYYRAVIIQKCRSCRNLPNKEHWTGKIVCNCGNPYVNRGLDSTHWIRAKKWIDKAHAEKYLGKLKGD
jgi:hypothetical protein